MQHDGLAATKIIENEENPRYFTREHAERRELVRESVLVKLGHVVHSGTPIDRSEPLWQPTTSPRRTDRI